MNITFAPLFDLLFDDELNNEVVLISGGFSLDTNPVWEEYIAGWPRAYQEYFSLLREEVVADPSVYKKCAMDLERLRYVVCVEGRKLFLSFTFRAWGDFMSAIVGERESYLNYY